MKSTQHSAFVSYYNEGVREKLKNSPDGTYIIINNPAKNLSTNYSYPNNMQILIAYQGVVLPYNFQEDNSGNIWITVSPTTGPNWFSSPGAGAEVKQNSTFDYLINKDKLDIDGKLVKLGKPLNDLQIEQENKLQKFQP